MLSVQVTEPVFISVKGGWINPEDIMWVQTAKYNELMLLVGLPGMDKPIHLNEKDSENLRQYLESHTWLPDEDYEEEEEGELEDGI